MSSSIYRERENSQEIDFRQQPLVFIDLELTGLNVLEHEIIEIACLVVDPQTLETRKEYHCKVMPEYLETADPKALKMAGFSREAWEKEARPIKQVIEELNGLAPGGIFIGWNVSSDRPFLELAVRRQEMDLNFDHHWLDVSMLVYERLFDNENLERIKLTESCQVLGIPRGDKHTAMADVKATFEVYKALRIRRDLVE